MSITQKEFGRTHNGQVVKLYTLENESGAKAEILTYGATIRALQVPDKDGALADVVLGCDNIADYERQDASLGALIGRFANRIGGGKFTLNGLEYLLFCNNGNHHLHGGKEGFNRKVWKADVQGDILCLTYDSADGEEGYPGDLDVSVSYCFTEDNSLFIDYMASTSKDTILNLTNHSYFNLAGHNSGTVLTHQLKIYSDFFTENNEESLPTGAILPLAGTPLDFCEFHEVGERINEDNLQLKNGNGYDHNFILRRRGNELTLAAELWEPQSGRLMETYTTKPGVQLYTANFLDGVSGKDGAVYNSREALCLETQFYPNAMQYSHFPSPILRAGKIYRHTTVYRFTIE